MKKQRRLETLEPQYNYRKEPFVSDKTTEEAHAMMAAKAGMEHVRN